MDGFIVMTIYSSFLKPFREPQVSSFPLKNCWSFNLTLSCWLIWYLIYYQQTTSHWYHVCCLVLHLGVKQLCCSRVFVAWPTAEFAFLWSFKEIDVFHLSEETVNAPSPSTYHMFCDGADVVLLRSQLLSWYDKEKRELPWRTLVKRSASFTGFDNKISPF